MNSATIQAHIYKAYGISARVLGQAHTFYRSIPVNRVLGEDGTPILTELGAEIHVPTARYILDENGNRILGEDGNPLLAEVASPLTTIAYANLFVSLNAEDMKYIKPNKYGKPTWYALFDAKNSQVGDYFVGPAGTFFIAAMQLLLSILVVECNRVVTVFRPQVQGGVGAVDYSGTTDENMTPIMTDWPCSILQGTKGEKNESGLPGDVRSPWWTILLPYGGVQILPDDIITDDQGLRYVVSSQELTDLGYRITAMMAIA
jgi:hypothetical protein